MRQSDEQSSSQTELYLARLDDAGPARILISLKGYVDDPAFSPDGSMIAFLYVEGATRPASALAAIKPFAGVIGEDGIEIQRVARVTVPPNWNGDPAPLPAPADDHPVASRAIDHLLPLFDFLTPASLHIYEFDWAPGFEVSRLHRRRSTGREQLVGGQTLYASARRRAEDRSRAGGGSGRASRTADSLCPGGLPMASPSPLLAD